MKILTTLKKNIMLSVAGMLTTTMVLAVPAKPGVHTLRLADGKLIKAELKGDEHAHWFAAEDGKAYSIDNKGVACEMTAEVMKEVMDHARQVKARSNARRQQRMAQGPRHGFGEQNYYLGDKKGIVVLVNFADKQMSANHDAALFDQRFNEEGYTNNNGYVGSVHDYFYDQSYGQFNLTFDIVGPITMSKGYAYYGQDMGGRGDDMRVPEMVGEALNMIDDEVDFTQYDWDGDGFVDQVFFIYAGCGQAQGAESNTIWPHEWSLEDASYYGYGPGILEYDGVYVNTYAVSCENQGGYGSTIDGIGTACHEFSHCLGFPDLYDTDYSGGVGMGEWDLLCSGSYNGPGGAGEVPAAYSSYERWMAGWLEPTELSNGCIITGMEALTSEPECYIIYNEGNHDEFYMLENRQCEKWDYYTKGKGMLVVHIDYDYDIWVNNAVNDNPSHQRYTIIPADGKLSDYYSSSMSGDPYPGSTGNTSLTDTSSPAATVYTINPEVGAKLMGKPIEEIEDNNGLISFRFMGGIPIAVPKAYEALDVTSDSFTAQWGEVEGALSYTLEYRPYNGVDNPEECLLISESFSNFEGTPKGGDRGTDISDILNTYMHKAGWTGKKVFSGPARVKIGSSSTPGYLMTPELDKPLSNSVTARLRMASYDGTTFNATISVIDAETDEVVAEQVVEVPESLGYITVSASGVMNKCKVRIAPEKRAHMYYAAFYDGAFADIDFSKQASNGEGEDDTTVIIEDITETTYTISGLTGEYYKYRVCAVCEEGATKWSNVIKVRLQSGESSIQGVMTEKQVLSNAYDLQGRRVDATKAKPGIYVMDGHKVVNM